MSTSKEDIEKYFRHGTMIGATHMIMVVDTSKWEDYPVYVMPGQDVREVSKEYSDNNWLSIMEIYNLSMDMKKQLLEIRAIHI